MLDADGVDGDEEARAFDGLADGLVLVLGILLMLGCDDGIILGS